MGSGALLGLMCRCIGSGEDVGNIKLRDNSASIELSAKGAALFESRRRLAREGLNVTSVRKMIRPMSPTAGTEARQGRKQGTVPRPQTLRHKGRVPTVQEKTHSQVTVL